MTDIENPQADASAGQEASPGTRLLLRLVYIMGVVLVLLLIILIGGIVWKAARPSMPKAAEAPAAYDLGLAPGETVLAVALDGERMAVTTSSGIVVVDLRRHRVEARIGLRPQ